MGEDKALLPFADFDTLTQFQLHRLQKLFSSVYISCKDKDKFDFFDKDLFIEDISSSDIYAPTAGFVAIFKKLKVDKIFILSVDSPFVGKSEILAILEADSDEFDATIAKTEFGIQPMCGIYHKSLEKEFIKMLRDDNHKLGYLLKNSKTKYVEFEDEKSFLNLNNQQEYQEALKILNFYLIHDVRD